MVSRSNLYRALLTAGTLTWASSIAFGFGALWKYQRAPGVAADAQPSWPAASTLARPSDRPRLVQFIHPRCPCSRASLAELRALLDHVRDPPAVQVVFIRPGGLGVGWEKSANWEIAGEIPGVTRVVDANGEEAARFGVETSGQTFLYSAKGELLFQGGLTASRGEVGDNEGSMNVLAALQGSATEPTHSAVYGCATKDPE